MIVPASLWISVLGCVIFIFVWADSPGHADDLVLGKYVEWPALSLRVPAPMGGDANPVVLDGGLGDDVGVAPSAPPGHAPRDNVSREVCA